MKLREHQLDGVRFLLAHPKGYLAHRPGLGKTRTLIQSAQLEGVLHPLVATPAIVRTHWHREFEAMDFRGEPQVRSYDELMRGGVPLMRELLEGGVDALILDEAHRLKHGSAKRTKILLGKDGYARRLPVVWAASGTPLPRNPAEIWTLLASVFPWVPLSRGIKTYQQFVDRYCISRPVFARGTMRMKIIGNNPEHLDELREMLAEVMQVREPGDDMPTIDWQVLTLNGNTPADTEIGEHAVKVHLGTYGWDSLIDIANDAHVARMRRRLGELKVAPVVDLLKSQLENSDEKVVVFAHHRSVLEGLAEGLGDFGVSYIDGDTTPSERDWELEQFQLDPMQGGTRVFIGQNIACMEGMDGLQHATNHAILVEPDWTASVNDQLGHRVARMGSASNYAIVQMVALAGTLDEAIVAQNKRETEMVAQAMPAGV